MNEERTMGEFLNNSKVRSAKSVIMALGIACLLVGVIYTGIHNYNLFVKTLPSDQHIFALIPVVLIEGSVLLFIAGGFFWFAGGAQKIVAVTAGWGLFIVIAANTIIDSQLQAGSAQDDWLKIYSTILLYGMPVLVMAIWKLILDLDPAKRSLEMRKSVEYATEEAKFAHMRTALSGEVNRKALEDFGAQFGEWMAGNIRASAPDVTVRRPPPASAQVLARDASLDVDDHGATPEERREYLAWLPAGVPDTGTTWAQWQSRGNVLAVPNAVEAEAERGAIPGEPLDDVEMLRRLAGVGHGPKAPRKKTR